MILSTGGKQVREIWNFDIGVVESNASLYLDFKFGLQPWVELGSTGTWSAEYGIDVNVDLPNAVIIPAYASGTPLEDRVGATMAFDFSDYEVVYGIVRTVGFSTDEDAEEDDPRAQSGIDLIVKFSAGVEDFYLNGPLPSVAGVVGAVIDGVKSIGGAISSVGSSIGSALGFGIFSDAINYDPDEFSASNVSFFDVSLQETLFNVEAGEEEFRPSIPKIGDFLEFYLKAPTGADTFGLEEGTGTVTARGSSKERFTGIEGDIDAILLELAGKIPEPNIKAAVKALKATVFWEGNVLNWAAENSEIEGIPKIPDSLANFDLTVVDLTAGLGLTLAEEFTVDINDPETGTPDVLVHLVGEDGSEARGKLGDTLFLTSPKENYGKTKVTATYTLGKVQAEHTAHIDLDFYFNVKILEGSIKVLGKEITSFGPLYDKDVVELEIATLGEGWSEKYTVDGLSFGTQRDTYEVFYVEHRLAPVGWDPESASFENDLYAYFEGAYEQVEAIFATYDAMTFDFERPTDETAVPSDRIVNLTGDETIGGVFYDYRGKSVGYAWSGFFDTDVQLTHDNGASRVLVGAQIVPGAGGAPDSDNALKSVSGLTDSGDMSFAKVSTTSHFTRKYSALISADDTAKVHYEANNGKFLETRNVTDVLGGDLGDVMYYHYDNTRDSAGGTFFDGGGNKLGTHDLFIGDFSDTSSPFYWDIAAAVNAENDGDARTKGGVTFKDRLGQDVVVRNIEAAFLMTGSGDDYLVGGRYSDGFLTGGGDDIVRLTGYIEHAGSDPETFGRQDLADDYVRLGSGKDTALVEFGDVPVPHTNAFTDYIFGGKGADHLYVRNGEQGLRYNFQVETSSSDVIYAFSGNGIGFDADHNLIGAYLHLFSRDYEDNFGVFSDDEFYAKQHYLMLNGGKNQGQIQIAQDVEYINVMTSSDGVDGKGGGTGNGDDLVIFMNGKVYQGGEGTDTFAADLTTNEVYTNDRGGIFLNVDSVRGDVPQQAYFGDTEISGFERLYVVGTSVGDVLGGGRLEDYLDGGKGNDFLHGGFDTVADQLYGGKGDDGFLWQGGGDDLIDGGDGLDTLYIGAFNSPLGAGEETFEMRGSTSYTLLDAGGDETASLRSSISTNTVSFRDSVVDFLDKVKSADSMAISGGDGSVATVRNVEVINVIASDSGNDVVLYQGGSTYIGGKSISGKDRDAFVADFRDQDIGIELDLSGDSTTGESTGYLLANSVYIEEMEQGFILAGDGFDILSGGGLGDLFLGGGGNDVLLGNGGNDWIEGGLGNDTVFYDSFGYDVLFGGTEKENTYVDGRLVQNVVENDNLVITGGTYDIRVRPYDADGNLILSTKNGIAFAHTDRDDLTELAQASQSVSEWQVYTRTPGSLRNTTDPSLLNVRYSEFESVDIAGVEGFDDLIVYQNGTGYTGGEGDGDTGEADLFLGDFRAYSEDLSFDGKSASGESYDIGQGTRIADFERFHLILGAGDDTVEGGDLDDAVFAGGGSDVLIGGAGNDHFFGQAGNDTFEHTYGKDVFDGGAGSGDILTISGRADALSVEMFAADGGSLLNLSMDSATPSFAEFRAALTAAPETITMSHGSNSVSVSGIEEYLIAGSEANDVLIGGTTQGVLFGGGGKDALIGQGGNDFMSGGAGSDIYVFGADFGQDVIFGETRGSSRLIFTELFKDDLDFTLDGIDLIVSDGVNSVRIKDYFAEDDTFGLNFAFETADGTFTKDFSDLGAISPGARVKGVSEFGTDDDDKGKGSADADVFRGFSGDDSYSYTGGGDLFDGGAGRDSYSFSGAPTGGIVDLLAFTATVGAAAEDLLVSIENISGSSHKDKITGNQFSNVLAGNGGNDKIFGNNGGDLLLGGAGRDKIDGGDDDDQVFGGEGKDKVLGQDGADVLFGGEGKDKLKGGDGDDLLSGDSGKDRIFGGDGDDILIATEGRDYMHGGAGRDTISFAQLYQGMVVKLDDGSSVRSRATEDRASATVAKLFSIENVLGSDEDDNISGNEFANHLDGAAGDDVLTGHAGEDTLNGGAGIDMLDYSRETGTSGVTVDLQRVDREFAIDTHGDRDIVSRIEGARGTDLVDILTGGDDGNIFYGLAGDDTLKGKSGNDILSGGDGDDHIEGGTGQDIITGGNGDDTVFGDKGDDLIMGGAGDDSIFGGEDDHESDDWDGLSYATITTGVSINFNQRTVTGVDVGKDKYRDIEYLIGSTGDDTVSGGSNIDHYHYVGGFDTYDGGGNRDSVSFEYYSASVYVDLTRSDAAWTADGKELPVFGDLRQLMELNSVNRATGTAFDDHLIGYELDNRLYGGAGNDVLNGGMSADPGYDDHLFGGAGNDTLVGAIGVDASFTSENIYDGGEGGDTVDFSGYETGVTFSLVNGDGNDKIVAVERLLGSDHDDVLLGDDAANVLDGGAGNDDLDGGIGDDLISYSGGVDIVRGGADSDTLDFTGFKSAVDVDLAAGEVKTGRTKVWSDGTAELIVSLPDLDVENAIGSRFADRLTGTEGANLLAGGRGNDVLRGLGGDDIFAYGSGQDTWTGGVGRDTATFAIHTLGVNIDLKDGVAKNNDEKAKLLVTMSEIEDAVGTVEADQITGDAKANRLDGLTGDDTLNGGAGADWLSGGGGLDVLAGGAGADTLDGGDGLDIADYALSTEAVSIDLATGLGSDGHAEGDILRRIEAVRGSEFADTISGSDADEVMIGEKGEDVLLGKSGNDTLVGGLGADKLNGGDGIDLVSFASAGAAVKVDLGAGEGSQGEAKGDTYKKIEAVLGSDHDDHLTGTGGRNGLFGGKGADELYGKGGADLLVGDGGGDALFGGAGNDQLFGGAGKDILSGDTGNDFMAGGLGDDVYVITDDELDEIQELKDEGHDLVETAVSFSLDANLEDLRLTGSASIDGIGNALGNQIFGNNNANQLDGLSGDDTLRGNDGADQLQGGKGNDLLFGGEGDDTLGGNAGKDTLEGGAGNDRLTGGGGNDVFVFADGFGSDVLVDFNSKKNLERIDLSDVTSITDFKDLVKGSSPHMTQVGADVVIDALAGNSITILNVSLGAMNNGDFIF
ncbi:calcium-binding protein [Neptunicoccus cionae]|nr:calcium-binding protein [Amylibacter cionae]